MINHTQSKIKNHVSFTIPHARVHPYVEKNHEWLEKMNLESEYQFSPY